MANGGGLMLKTAVTFGVTALTSVLGFMGYTVKENRETNVKEHSAIVDTMHTGFGEQMKAQHSQYKDLMKEIKNLK